jgi:hypothetical protein
LLMPCAFGALHLFGGHSFECHFEGLRMGLVRAVSRGRAGRRDLFGCTSKGQFAFLIIFHGHPGQDTHKALEGRAGGGVAGGLGRDWDRMALSPSSRGGPLDSSRGSRWKYTCASTSSSSIRSSSSAKCCCQAASFWESSKLARALVHLRYTCCSSERGSCLPPQSKAMRLTSAEPP